MKTPPLLVLIRPERQSRWLLRACAAKLGNSVPALIAPIINITGMDIPVDLGPYDGVIASSANAIHFAGNLGGKRLYCVGKRTEIAARQAGAEVVWTARDSHELQEWLRQHGPEGKLVFLRGMHVAKGLELPEIETDELIVYDQVAQEPSLEVQHIITGDQPAVLPLYSPRSALLLGQSIECAGPRLHVIAISQKVAKQWKQATGGESEICDMPTGSEMVERIVSALKVDSA